MPFHPSLEHGLKYCPIPIRIDQIVSESTDNDLESELSNRNRWNRIGIANTRIV